ncbi:MAG: dTDP-4-dehydrorhamnose reductase [Ginsengibacter sp.]
MIDNSFSSAPTILVTGANGQLGMELQKLATYYPSYQFLFTSKENLPIDNFEMVQKYFEAQQVDYCINCAAYTAVDKAESETERAYLINAGAVANLAKICQHHQTDLIHISTDYVFSGNSSRPYKEDDAIAPINIYGASKLKGEELAFNNNTSVLIIRTSWVYSSFGSNFVKTMVRLLKEKESINVVNDQFGSPTYAADIAKVIMKIIDHSKTNWIPGIVNYCSEGITNWYEFALAIKDIIKSNCIVNPVPSSEYKTRAARPKFSALDTEKIRKLFGISIPNWKYSLQQCLSTLQ